MQSEENNNLKKIRKDKGLSIESVANSLKLTTDVIRKLEVSDFDNLGAYTYIRGYIGQYAKLLEVDAEPYIDLIPKSKIDVPLFNTSSKTSNTIKFKKQSKNLFNYAIGTFIVAAVSFSGYYLLKNYSGINETNEIVDTKSLMITPKDLDQDQQSITNDKLLESTTDESFHYSSLIPTGVNNQKTVVSESSKSSDVKGVEVADVSLNEGSQVTIEENNEVLAVAYHVVINALETSWVKVENQDGKLHNDLLQPGSITLTSDKAMHFRIGNEKNVTLTINGESIDLSEFSSKDVADFNWPIES